MHGTSTNVGRGRYNVLGHALTKQSVCFLDLKPSHLDYSWQTWEFGICTSGIMIDDDWSNIDPDIGFFFYDYNMEHL